jgi:hypothetical protein
MVQAADFGHDPTDLGRLDGPEVGCVLVEREVGARLLVAGEDAVQMTSPRTSNLDANAYLTDVFRQGLRDLGYVEGRNVVIEYRYGEGKFERFPALASELVALKVDVIVASAGTSAALAAQQATRTILIVFIGAGDPVTSGLVTSLARPGGNLTGLSILAPALVGKRLEMLTQAVPGVSRVAVLRHPGFADERLEKPNLNGVVVSARARGRLVDLAAKSRLPAMYELREYVDAGGPYGLWTGLCGLDATRCDLRRQDSQRREA